jgi:hypothetical protein
VDPRHWGQLAKVAGSSDAVGDPAVYLTACGGLAAAWLSTGTGPEIQVCAEGTAFVQIEPVDGSYTLAAQYD